MNALLGPPETRTSRTTALYLRISAGGSVCLQQTQTCALFGQVSPARLCPTGQQHVTYPGSVASEAARRVGRAAADSPRWRAGTGIRLKIFESGIRVFASCGADAALRPILPAGARFG